jgi:putative membrane protein
MKWTGLQGLVFTGIVAAVGLDALLAQNFGTSTNADKTFLTEADEGNSAEIAASQTALKKSKNADVKAFAQQMIADHQKLRSDMVPLTQSSGVTTPQPLNATHQIAAKRLASLSGQDFDKEYIKAMDQDHHKMLGMFKSEATTTTNKDLKAAVLKGEKSIQHHTEMADQISQKMGLPTAKAL